MGRRKSVTVKKRKENTSEGNMRTQLSAVHEFDDEEINVIRKNLLSWYDTNKRDLPWRRMVAREDVNQRAYAVWVSEVMLQQTQVATVIDYYNKWMKKWPTLQDLAEASLEEVNEMWSGLGYYSRGRRLHEGAQKVVNSLKGEMPKTAEDLLHDLPGVGKYTAGAIASIAYNQATGVVDGNVIRVLSRLRLIGADSAAQQTMSYFWAQINKLVHPTRPGDFNQSMMELGATVCTPKSPNCQDCPAQTECKAFAKVERHKEEAASKLVNTGSTERVYDLDIECCADKCSLCPEKDYIWNSSLGVMNYPRKAKKKEARVENTAVCILCKKCLDCKNRFLLIQRPQKGLLAGLWEFPSVTIDKDGEAPDMLHLIDKKYSTEVEEVLEKHEVGQVTHIFSHIHQTYNVECVVTSEEKVSERVQSDDQRWVTKEEFLEAAVSTAMKKIFRAYEKTLEEKKKTKRKRESPGAESSDKKQRSISSFFKPKP